MSWHWKFEKSKKLREFEEKMDEILARMDVGQAGTSEERSEFSQVSLTNLDEVSGIPEEDLESFAKKLENLRLEKDEDAEKQWNARMERANAELERIKEQKVEVLRGEDSQDNEDLGFRRELDDLKRSHEERMMKMRVEREKLEQKTDAEHANLLKKLQSRNALEESVQAESKNTSDDSKRLEKPEETSELESFGSMNLAKLLDLIRFDCDDNDSDGSNDSEESEDSEESDDSEGSGDSNYPNDSDDSEDSEDPEEESESSLEEIPPNPSVLKFQSSLNTIVSNLKKSNIAVEEELDENLKLDEDNFVRSMQECLQEEEEFLEGFRRISSQKDSE